MPPFDGPAMVPLIAPRPLLAINGELDPRTPLPGLQECVDAAQAAYRAAGAEEREEVLVVLLVLGVQQIGRAHV